MKLNVVSVIAVIFLVALSSFARSAEWTAVGSAGQVKLVRALASNEKYIFAATLDFGGLYRSADQGKTWELKKLASNAQGISASQGISIAIHPTNPSTIYVGTGSQGLFRSTDNGGSWTQITATNKLEVMSVAVVASKLQTSIYIAGNAGCWVSTDDGESWNPLDIDLVGGCGHWVAIDPLNPKHLIVAGREMWASSDSGANFTKVALPVDDGISNVVFHAKSPRIYVSLINQGVLRSPDGGRNWTVINNGVGSGGANAYGVIKPGTNG